MLITLVFFYQYSAMFKLFDSSTRRFEKDSSIVYQNAISPKQLPGFRSIVFLRL